MKIVYYKSRLCPRCIPTNRFVSQLRRDHPEIEIEEIEVLTNLGRALRDGVTTLPTLVIGERRYHHAPSLQEIWAAAPTRVTVI